MRSRTACHARGRGFESRRALNSACKSAGRVRLGGARRPTGACLRALPPVSIGKGNLIASAVASRPGPPQSAHLGRPKARPLGRPSAVLSVLSAEAHPKVWTRHAQVRGGQEVRAAAITLRRWIVRTKRPCAVPPLDRRRAHHRNGRAAAGDRRTPDPRPRQGRLPRRRALLRDVGGLGRLLEDSTGRGALEHVNQRRRRHAHTDRP